VQSIANEIAAIGLQNYFKTTVSEFDLCLIIQCVYLSKSTGLAEDYCVCAFSFCIILFNILRLFDLPIQTSVLALASIVGWGYMLVFVVAFRFTGPFVVMIYEMLFNDVLRFFIIYIVFLMGFSQAFFVLFESNGMKNTFCFFLKQCIDLTRRFSGFSYNCQTMFLGHVRRF
jgi:hypothetical protein